MALTKRTFTYTAHGETMEPMEQCIQGVAALRQSNGTYRLVLSNVFGVLFDGGAVPEAKRAGARLGGAWHLPLVFANTPGQYPQSFVRLVNLTGAANRLRLRAYDEQGVMVPGSILLNPYAALHFNSADFEDGNDTKGVEPFGDRDGHWRLEIEPRRPGQRKPSLRRRRLRQNHRRSGQQLSDQPERLRRPHQQRQ